MSSCRRGRYWPWPCHRFAGLAFCWQQRPSRRSGQRCWLTAQASRASAAAIWHVEPAIARRGPLVPGNCLQAQASSGRGGRNRPCNRTLIDDVEVRPRLRRSLRLPPAEGVTCLPLVRHLTECFDLVSARIVTALCVDQTVTFNWNTRGACAEHGGFLAGERPLAASRQGLSPVCALPTRTEGSIVRGPEICGSVETSVRPAADSQPGSETQNVPEGSHGFPNQTPKPTPLPKSSRRGVPRRGRLSGQDLVFTFCNDLQAAYFGRAAEKVVGQRLHDVAPGKS